MKSSKIEEPQVHISVLGPIAIRHNTVPVTITSQKALALLCYLAVEQKPVTRQSLAGLLWPEAAEPTARSNLRTQLSTLRRLMGELFVTSRNAIAIREDIDVWLDARYLTTAAEGRSVEERKQAVDLYRGEFLEGFGVLNAPEFELWVLRTRESLHNHLLTILRTLADPISSAHLTDALTYARRWTDTAPLDEIAHRQVMLILAQIGQRTEALAQYETCRQLLAEELSLEPDAETEALRQQIVDGGALIPTFAAPMPRHTLPAAITSFVGRRAELDEVSTLLKNSDCRMVTLLGMGGMGKSRLALEIGHRLQQAATAIDESIFDDGIFWVPLVNVEDELAFYDALFQALGFSIVDGESSFSTLANNLHTKKCLLILDNFEQLMSQAQVLAHLLAAAPDITLLVTSRIPLEIHAEWRYPLTGMDAAHGGIELFCQRAQQGYPAFSNDVNDPNLRRICDLVGGLPLAIEVAAGWVRLLSSQEIAAEIQGNLDFLATKNQPTSRRQQSLRAILEHSWQWLQDEERQALSALSLFRGGFTRDSAWEVAGASISTLSSLVDNSLIASGANGRYEIHGLVRQYAAKKLAEKPGQYEQFRDRHCSFMAEFLQQAGQRLRYDDQVGAIADLAAEFDNIRLAWQRAVESCNIDALEKSIFCLWDFSPIRGSSQETEVAFRQAAEALNHLDPLETLTDVEQSQRTNVSALLGAGEGYFLAMRHSLVDGRQRMEACLNKMRCTVNRNLRQEDYVLARLTIIANDQGDFAYVERLFNERLQLNKQLSDSRSEAVAHFDYGFALKYRGRLKEAELHLRKSIRLFKELGERRVRSLAARAYADIAIMKGRYEEAQKLLTDCLDVAVEFHDSISQLFVYRTQGGLSLLQGNFSLAQQQLEACQEVADRSGNRWYLPYIDLLLGRLHSHWSNETDAIAHIEESVQSFRASGNQAGLAESLTEWGHLALEQREIAEAQSCYDEVLTIWQEAGNDFGIASTLRYRGHLAALLGERDSAEGYYLDALQLAEKLNAVPIVLDLLVGLVTIEYHTTPEHRAEWLAIAQGHPASTYETRQRAISVSDTALTASVNLSDQEWATRLRVALSTEFSECSITSNG